MRALSTLPHILDMYLFIVYYDRCMHKIINLVNNLLISFSSKSVLFQYWNEIKVFTKFRAEISTAFNWISTLWVNSCKINPNFCLFFFFFFLNHKLIFRPKGHELALEQFFNPKGTGIRQISPKKYVHGRLTTHGHLRHGYSGTVVVSLEVYRQISPLSGLIGALGALEA